MYHPTALVETDQIGEGTRIWAYAHVLPGAEIGARCNIGDHAFIEGGATLGDGVTLKNGVCVWEGVHLGDGVFVGPNAVFTNDLYPRSPRLPAAQERYGDKSWIEHTYVREGATIGANATIVCGTTIGEYAFIAAGALVTKDVAAHGFMLGAPARRRGWVCMCGRPLAVCDSGRWRCVQCGRTFREADGRLKVEY